MKRLVVILLSVWAAPAAAAGVPDVEEIADGDFLLDPPAMEYPGIRTPRVRTQIYTDFTFASSPKLDALSVVEGSAKVYRFALGGSLRIRDWEANLELPFAQITSGDFTKQLQSDMPVSQTRFSWGDVRVGGSYRTVIDYYPPKMIVGGSLQARLSTHDTTFSFPVPGGASVDYQFPHYWHIEPSGFFGTALGPLTLVTSQGFLAMLGKDVSYTVGPFALTQVFPELYFYDGHYALGFYFVGSFGFTLELNTVIQLNRVVDPPPPQPSFASVLNDIKAVYLLPGLQFYLGGFKLDVAGRIGLSDGADAFGVLTYSGRYSAMLRLTRSFDYDGIKLFGG